MRARIFGITFMLVVGTVCGMAQKLTTAVVKYDMASEVKIKGTVQEIRDVPGQFDGTNLVMKTDTGTVNVYVGPTAFLKEIDSSFKQGDPIEVMGAKAPNGSDYVILAREITSGTNGFTLRDDKGVPVWTGWKPAKVTK